MKKTVMQLEKLDLSKSNPVLWLGNGVNRTFQGDSWEEIVETELKKCDVDVKYNDIKNTNETTFFSSNDTIIMR